MIVRTSSEIYLDANATTPVLPEAAKVAHDAMEELYGNPSSSHISGLRARFILESARQLVQQILGAETGQIVFTSGATEAIQMGIFSTLVEVREKRKAGNTSDGKRKLLFGATEHKAVPQAIRHWNSLLGVDDEIVEIPVDEKGQLDLAFIRANAASADLICTMAVNNETGVITDLAEVEQAIRVENPEVSWVVDCVQAVGKLPLNLAETTISYAAVSGHKIYAPKGIGLLYVQEGMNLVPLLAGGGQEQGARGGTENLPGVAAIAAVMKRLVESETRTFADESKLESYRSRLAESLKQAFPTIEFNTPFESSVSTTLNFAVKGFPSKELLDLFDAAGIRVSSGSACGSAAQGSYVLDAMGLPTWRSEGAIRMSFGPMVSESEINAACDRISQAGQALCDSCLVLSSDADSISSQELDGLIQLKNGSMCTWLLMDAKSKRCIVIDPFEELSERAETLIRCQKSKVIAILDTHAHVDHDSCRQMLLKVIGDHAEPSATTSDLLGWPEIADGTAVLGDGTTGPFIRISEDKVIVQVDLPGHTTIGRSFFVGKLAVDNQLAPKDIEFAFTGDTILMGGIGRTDFPCSTIEGMYETLQRLPKILESKTLICPTHDYNSEFATTLEFEMGDNEYLRTILDHDNPLPIEEFLKTKPGVDSGISDETNSELVCGLIKNCESTDASIQIPSDQLRQFFEEHRQALVIDVREPHEFAFAQNWSELGFETPPENVPLTRLTGCLPRLLKAHQENPRDLIFLCRSGRRSGKAAEVARRVGIETAQNISGGIALNVKHQCVLEDIKNSGYMI